MRSKNGPQSSKTGSGIVEDTFASLPLDEKFSSLVKMEVATISEAFNYVISDPMKVVAKIGEAISDLGTRVEREVKDAAAGNVGGKRATSEEESDSKRRRSKTSAKAAPDDKDNV